MRTVLALLFSLAAATTTAAPLPPAARAEVNALEEDGTISGGMIPKVETCIEAIERGVQGVVILDGKTPHAVLLELFTEHGAGTLIVP